MKKLYCVICGRYRKFICSKCKNEDENIFKEQKSIEILKKFLV